MRKRFIALAVLACLICSVPAAAETAVAEISDRAGLEAIAENPDGRYVLTADIDLGTEPWTPIAFSGTLEGGGHTVYNLYVNAPGAETRETVDGNSLVYDTGFAALFSVADGAVIRDVALAGVNVDLAADANCFAAALVGYAVRTEIASCSVQGRVQLQPYAKMAGVGGLCGFSNDSVIRDCRADVTLVYTDRDREHNGESFAGGVFACGFAEVEGCAVRLFGYTSVFGYTHNGGLAGMYYAFDRDAACRRRVKNCTVDATFRFFEKVASRRAYCKAYLGENLFDGCKLAENRVDSFQKTESKDYATPLLPEMCPAPVYTDAVTPPSCTACGYTTHTCQTCGYAYTDAYTLPRHTCGAPVVTPPTCTEAGYSTYTCTLCGQAHRDDTTPAAHKPGDWAEQTPPGYGVPGTEARRCTVCGQTVDTRETPALIRTESITLSAGQMRLRYKETAVLTGTAAPADASAPGMVWSSSDETVARVFPDGTVTATGRGNAVITAAAADGGAEAACAVTVSYAWWQWLIVTLLLGFLWY